MLHPFDDYPIHQTPEPILHVGSESANAYDRFFFNGFSRSAAADPATDGTGTDGTATDGSQPRGTGPLFFAVAFGVYPNRQVADGAFSVIVDGVQHNVRASRRMPADRTATSAGPLTIEVIQPMVEHRVIVDGQGAHDHGIRADLTYRAITPVIEEPRFTWREGGRVRMDYTRMTQFGAWTGWIELDGQRFDLGSDFVGVRDRSWGLRPVGAPIDAAPSIPQLFWLWTPTIFDDCVTHAALNDHADGQPWHRSGAIIPLLQPSDDPLNDHSILRSSTVNAALDLQPGTRWARELTVELQRWDPTAGPGATTSETITYEPVFNFHMSGIGYRHPEWGHGRWVGEDVSHRDRLVLADVDPLSPTILHIQAISRARWGDRVGVGVVEQLIVGPHAPSGLTGLLDGSPEQ